MVKLTTTELKLANRRNVFEWIYREKNTSKQEIASGLNLSLPTVSHNLAYLESLRLIESEDYFESTGGRKARIVSLCSQARIALGVSIMKNKYSVVAIDLYGNIIRSMSASVRFSNNYIYCQAICKSVIQLIDSMHIPNKNVLGVGIGLQGILAVDGSSIVYGKSLGSSGLNIARFSEFLPYPCKLVQDAEAAAQCEIWSSPKTKNAFYLLIEEHVSGAIIANNTFWHGEDLGNSILEHMTIVPNGKPCYCGKRGCLDCYCSSQGFLEEGESEKFFYEKLKDGDAAVAQKWNMYLNYLATAIENLHLIVDCDIVLGGSVGQQLTEKDIQTLHRLVNERAAFTTDREFIRKAKLANNIVSTGAALIFVSKFLSKVI